MIEFTIIIFLGFFSFGEMMTKRNVRAPALALEKATRRFVESSSLDQKDSRKAIVV